MASAGGDCHLKLDIGGTEVALMIEKRPPNDPQGGGYQYSEGEVPSTNTGLLVEASTGDILWPPQVEVPFSQNNWQGGAGFRENDGKGTMGYVTGAWVDDEKITAPLAAITDEADYTAPTYAQPWAYFESKLYTVFEGRYLYRRDSIGSPSTWTQVLDVGGARDITQIVVFKGYIIVGVSVSLGSSLRYWYSDSGDSGDWTNRATATGSTCAYFAVLRDTLWGVVYPATAYSTTDPTDAGTWASATTIGDGTHAVLNALSGPDFIVFFTTHLGLALFPNGTLQEVVTAWRYHPNLNKEFAHFRHAAQDGQIIYFSAGPDLYSYNTYSGLILPFGLPKLVPYNIDRVSGVAVDAPNVWILARGQPSASTWIQYLFRCRRRGDTWACVPVWSLNTTSNEPERNTMVAVTEVSDSEERDLTWEARQADGTHDLLRIRYSPYEDLSTYGANFASGFRVRTGRIDHGRPDLVKQWPYIIVHAQNYHASKEVKVYYDVDSAGSFTLLGPTIANGANYLNFPAGTNGHHIELEFEMEASGASPAQLFGYSLPAHVKLKRRKMFTARVRIADGMIMLNGAVSPVKGEWLRTQLRGARTATGSVKLSDFMDSTDVEIYILSMKFDPTRHESPHEGEYTAEFVAVEATQGA